MRVEQEGFSQKKPGQLVYLELGSGNGGLLLRVSEDGFRFRAVTPVRANGDIPFAFSLDGKIRLEGTGAIEWIEDDGKSGGMRFAEVSPEFRAILADWLSADSSPREDSKAPATADDTMEKIQQELRSGYPQRPPKTPSQQKPPERKPEALKPGRTYRPDVPEQKIKDLEQKPKSVVAAKPFPAIEPNTASRLFPLQAPPVEPEKLSSSAFLKPVVETKVPAVNPVASTPRPARSMFSARSTSAVPDAPAVPEPVQTAAPSRPYIPPLEDTFDNAWEHARLTAPQESPHLSRAAAGSIIAIALAAILGALIYNFRQDIGGTFIQLGQSISGRNSSTTSGPAQETKSDAAPSDQQKPEQKPADSDVQTGSLPENSSGTANPDPSSPNANGEGGRPASGASGGKNGVSGSDNAQNTESLPLSSAPSSNPSTSSASSGKPSENPAVQIPADGNGKKTTLQATSSGMPTGMPAATSGDAGSGQEEFKVAEDILRGSNRRRDLQVAVSLLWSGVRKGYVPAEVALADLFRRGEGVPRNCDQARVLLVAASKRGSFDARLMLEKMAEQGCE